MKAPRWLHRKLAFAWLLILFAFGVVGLVLGRMHYQKTPHPQSFHLDSQSLNQMHSWGGIWEAENGIVRNNSDERGAKLLMGNKAWRDYTMSADLRFDGNHGDMGVVVRSSDEEDGVDAYNGYYVGLRTTDGMLIVGRSDHGWIEAPPALMPGGVHYGVWYRLVVTVVGCQIAASSENLSTGETASIAVTEDPCAAAGRIGLRSLATGGSWRNIQVKPAAQSDYELLRMHAAQVVHPEFPRREADYNRSFHFSISNPMPRADSVDADLRNPVRLKTSDLQRLSRSQNVPVRVRGVVTQATPELYVQDSDGGVLVRDAERPPLNIGDVVELSGRAYPGLYSSEIRGGTVHLQWSGQPLPPIAITAMQAASGSYDARYVEVEGRLTKISRGEGKEELFELEGDGQQFSAVYANPSAGELPHFKINSLLRVRGICVLGSRTMQISTPFVVLLRSNTDVQIMAPPPWWTPAHIAMLVVALIALALLLQLAYFRLREWKAETILKERERLAHDLHDTMAQSFAGVGYQIQGIRSGLKRREDANIPMVIAQLDLAYQTVRKLHEEASQIIAMLHAAPTDAQKNLLDSLILTTRKITCDRVQTESQVQGESFPLNLHLANALLQIGQEAITNAVIHGMPQTIHVTIVYSDPLVELVICDDGRGFDSSTTDEGFGIEGMRKRARSVGATLQIESRPAAGCCVRVRASSQPFTISARIIAIVQEMVGHLRGRQKS